MYNAVILSSRPGWAAESGLADTLPGLGLSAHQAPWPVAAPAASRGYIVAFIQLAAGDAAPDPGQLRRAGLSGAIVLTCGTVSAGPPPAHPHLADPVDEGALAAALAGAGYVLPLPAGPAIGRHVSQLVDNDPAVTAELIASLLDTNQSDLHHFQQACAAQCWPDVRACAHRIKGTAHMAGAAALAALSQRIETLARQGRGDTVLALAALYTPAVERLSRTLAALAG